MSPLASHLVVWVIPGLIIGLATYVAFQRVRIAELRREADVLFAELLRPRFVDWRAVYLPDDEEGTAA